MILSSKNRKKLVIATEVLRTLSSNDLVDAVGGADDHKARPGFFQWLQNYSVIPTCVMCFGQSGLCHGANSQALRRQDRAHER